MAILSVNIGRRRSFEVGGRSVETGAVKLPVEGRVTIGGEGLHGDVIVNGKVHGGPDQAVYLYGSVDYDWWREMHDYDEAAGFFGENLTVDQMASAGISVGDRFVIGDHVELEATGPRLPCAVMAKRSGDRQFVKRFLAAGRPGVYCRVIRGGEVEAGLPVRSVPTSGPKVTMAVLADAYYRKDLPREEIEAILAVPIGDRLIEKFTAMLAES